MPLQRKVPKRGFTNISRKRFAVVNVDDLNRFSSGSEIGPTQLIESRLVRKILDGIKLLGEGEITYPVTVQVHKASASAVTKIEAAGGRVELIPSQKRN
jgi:large subunit ribosomal protein L15